MNTQDWPLSKRMFWETAYCAIVGPALVSHIERQHPDDTLISHCALIADELTKEWSKRFGQESTE